MTTAPIQPPKLRMERRSTAEEAVADALRNAIRDRVLPPGQRLAQADLAAQLGVSRIPLWAALRRLAEEGLVRIEEHRGAWVAELTRPELMEIYELRIMLETRCIRHALEGLSDEDAARLVELSETKATGDFDPVEGLAIRRDFYDELYSHAGRPRMHKLIMQLRNNTQRYLLLWREHGHQATIDLREAIMTRNGELAAEMIEQHLEEARDDLLRILEREEALASEEEVLAPG